jgi:tetratricopeptide (TPR) repeat protein
MSGTSNINLHYSIAEQGKVMALQGNHKEALRHYKEALRMCQALPNADLFFQHYSLCAMESLELMGAYNEVVEFCDKCLDFLVSKEKLKDNPVFEKYFASILERKGVQFLLLDEKQEAIAAFKSVQERVGKTMMPLTNELLNWATRGYSISPGQIRDLQKKHKYFTVRKENVNEKIAIELPQNINPY